MKTKHRMVDLENLNICHDYQRPLRKHRVRQIVDNFNPDATVSLCVGEREDGSLWLVDGGHRRAAMLRMGYTKWGCDIFQSDGPANEARIYLLLNGERFTPSSHNQFRAKLTAGDAQAHAILAIVESAGLKMFLDDSDPKGWPYLRCVAAVVGTYDRGGEHLTRVLNIIMQSWEGERDALRGVVISGLSMFLHRCEGVDDKRLVHKLGVVIPTAILRYADSHLQLAGGSRHLAVAAAFLKFYNKGLRTRKAKWAVGS